MSKPKVTIYTVAYNAEKYIAQAIESVLAQTFTDFEYIIVNDGSTDGTADIIESYAIKNWPFPRDFRFIRFWQEHSNFATGMNRAIQEAKGEYILGVDADDYISPDYLEQMMKAVEENPGYDYYYPSGFEKADEAVRGICTQRFLEFADNEEIQNFILKNNYSPIPNPGSLKSKAMFLRLGGYRDLETCEDFDFLCRNVLSMTFKMVKQTEGQRLLAPADYFYRHLPTSNSHKTEARKKVHEEAREYLTAESGEKHEDKLDKDISAEMYEAHQQTADKLVRDMDKLVRDIIKGNQKILLCSPWDNCWLRYFTKYFTGKGYEVKTLKYKGWKTPEEDGREQMNWADVVFFMWSDAFLKYWTNREDEKRPGQKYIAFMRSYELWDTNHPWKINWKNVDHLIFVNPVIRACFELNAKDRIKDFNTPTHCIPNAIDLEEWKFIARDRPNKKIAWVNDFSHKKGIQMLVQVAHKMPYDYTIFPAGSQGDFRSGFYYNHITREMRIENRIAVIKRHKDVQGFLGDKSFALCTSVVEGHPNALVEAMAVGIKPVIHNFPGAKELFPEELVYNTPEEAVEILQGTYSSSKYREYVENHYDMNTVYEKIEGLF